jgi:cytochrome P450 family 144
VTEGIPPQQLLAPAVIDNPYPFYRRLRTEAPVWDVANTGIFTVSTDALVAEATNRVEDFSSNIECLLYRDDAGLPSRISFGGDGIQVLATADPPVHPVHRRTVFPGLVARRMRTLEPDIVEIAEGAVAAMLGCGGGDFMADVGNLVPITMISRLIGFRDADLDQLLTAAFDSTSLLGSTLTLDELTTLIGRSEDVQTFIAERLALALKDPREDLLGAVAHGVRQQVFDEVAATIMLQTLLSAGGESTTSLLGNAVRILAENYQLQQHLREHPEQMEAFVEEALRLESPFRFHMRSVHHDTELGNVRVPAGSTLLLLWGSANRDETEYDQPEGIDLDRPVPRHHLGFGRGIHHCVGAPLARLEAQIVLRVFLTQTSRIELDPVRRPKWVQSLMVRRHEELFLRVQPA